jgi:hypothetical protein
LVVMCVRVSERERGYVAHIYTHAGSRLIAGVIDVGRQNLFKRMVFRVSRGNAYVQFVPIQVCVWWCSVE